MLNSTNSNNLDVNDHKISNNPQKSSLGKWITCKKYNSSRKKLTKIKTKTRLKFADQVVNILQNMKENF